MGGPFTNTPRYYSVWKHLGIGSSTTTRGCDTEPAFDEESGVGYDRPTSPWLPCASVGVCSIIPTFSVIDHTNSHRCRRIACLETDHLNCFRHHLQGIRGIFPVHMVDRGFHATATGI